MDRYVIFKDGNVRIQYTKPESGTFLVNPVFPRGVPPHLWKLKDGAIEGALPATNLASAEITNKLSKIVIFMIGLLSGGTLSGIIWYILR